MAEERTVLNGATDVLSSEGIGAGLKYPIRGHRFAVEVEGLSLMSFKSVSSISVELGTTEYREGAFATLGPRKIPAMMSYPDVTLEKGMYNSPVLYEYFMGYVNGTSLDVHRMLITAYDNAGNPCAQWEALNVWPYRYESPGLSADSADILIESVTFATEGIYRITL